MLEYSRRPVAPTRIQGETFGSRSGESTRISALETRVVDLASQVTQNLAMVDFKDILMQLLNASTCIDRAPSRTSMGAGDPTKTPLQERAPSEPLRQCPPLINPNVQEEPQPSWMSAETVLLTPNTRNTLRPRSTHDIGMAAISTNVSNESIANGSVNTSAGPVEGSAPQSNTSA